MAQPTESFSWNCFLYSSSVIAILLRWLPAQYKDISMKLHPTLFQLFCLLACSLPWLPTAHAAIVDCEINGKSVSPDNGNTTAGLSGIMRCVDRKTRVIVREDEFNNGRKFGLVKRYEEGKLVREYKENAKGAREASYRELTIAGQVIVDEMYDSGERVGLQKYFFDDGSLKRLDFFGNAQQQANTSAAMANIEFNANGTMANFRCANQPVLNYQKWSDKPLCGFNGETSTQLYSSNGTLREKRTVASGKIMASDTYASNGKPQYQAIRKGNKLIETRFNSNTGAKVRETGFTDVNSNQVREYEQEFHESGTKIAEKRWAADNTETETAWYLNGQVRSEAKQSLQQRSLKEFFDNGKPALEETYAKLGEQFLPVGTHKVWDKNGIIRAETTFDAKGKLNRERLYNKDGVLTQDDEVFEDGSRKKFIK
jgi:antitoxin component YwqK of YwqJK toxin-antitoxin module